MRMSELMVSIEAVRRKLRAVTAVVEDTSATEHERANAESVKKRLEQQLRDAGVPTGDWTDNAFQLGQWTKDIMECLSSSQPKGHRIDHLFRLGKVMRRGYKRWFSS